MPNEVHRKILVAVGDFDLDAAFAELDSLADGDLAWTAPVTTCEDCDFVDCFFKIKTGTSPTSGGTISFFVGRGDDEAGELRSGTDDITTTDHGTETVAGDITRVLGTLGGQLGQIVVDGTSNKIYTHSFRIWYPGADFNVYIYNETGAALNGSGSPHEAHFRGWGDEIQ